LKGKSGKGKVARLAFLGQFSEIWPHFQLDALKKFNWPFLASSQVGWP